MVADHIVAFQVFAGLASFVVYEVTKWHAVFLLQSALFYALAATIASQSFLYRRSLVLRASGAVVLVHSVGGLLVFTLFGVRNYVPGYGVLREVWGTVLHTRSLRGILLLAFAVCVFSYLHGRGVFTARHSVGDANA